MPAAGLRLEYVVRPLISHGKQNLQQVFACFSCCNVNGLHDAVCSRPRVQRATSSQLQASGWGQGSRQILQQARRRKVSATHLPSGSRRWHSAARPRRRRTGRTSGCRSGQCRRPGCCSASDAAAATAARALRSLLSCSPGAQQAQHVSCQSCQISNCKAQQSTAQRQKLVRRRWFLGLSRLC